MKLNTALRGSIITLLFATLITPLVVSTSLYFPFITGKGFLFRTLVEIALLLYIILVVRDRSYLPKKSALMWSLVAFLGVMAVATITSANPYKSFWSNYERMEGYVTLLHLGAYLLMFATIFNRRMWQWFFNASLVVSIITGLYAFMDRFANPPIERIQGTLGNSTYLGVYALLHIFLCIFLGVRVFKDNISKKAAWWIAGVYAVIGLFNAYVMYSTGTRGSFVGLLAGGFLTIILMAIFEKNHPLVRKVAAGICAVAILAIIILGAAKNTSVVQSSPLLSRFAPLITFNVESVIENQGYARTLLWGIALKGFEERPILGWGQESFNYVFAKYYDPRMYNQEQWFDRSHNVFLDWLIAGGILGLLAYLSLFATMIYLLWKKNHEHQEEPWTVVESSILTGLLAAYFVHNIFVFDNLVSYVFFFALLAYVHQRSTTHLHEKDKQSHLPLIENDAYQIIAGVVAAVVIGIALTYSVVKPYLQSDYLIKGLEANAAATQQSSDASSTPPSAQQINGANTVALNFFNQAYGMNTFGDSETNERLTDVAGSVLANPSSDPSLVQKFDQLMQTRYTMQFAATPKDPRPYIFYGTYLLQTNRITQAISVLQTAVNLSPNKQSFLSQLAIAYYTNHDYDHAIPLLKQAYESDTADTDALAVYSAVLIYSGQATTSDQLLAAAAAQGNDLTADSRILQAYLDTKDFTRLFALAKAQLAAKPNDPQTHVSAAAIYIKGGDRTDAIKQLMIAETLAPSFKAQADAYIQVIKAGGDPTQQPQ